MPIPALPVEDLREICNPKDLFCDNLDDVKPLETIVGQERAIRALKFGLGNRSPGFNVYVSGEPGTGRLYTVRRFLKSIAKNDPTPSDWCYVYNFSDPYHPRKLEFPKGRAREFQSDVRLLVAECRQALQLVFESDEFAEKKRELVEDVSQKKNTILSKLNKLANKRGFTIKITPMGAMVIPLVDGKPMKEEEYAELAEEKREVIIKEQRVLDTEMQSTLRKVRELEKEAVDGMKKLQEEAASYAIELSFEEIGEKYAAVPDAGIFLQEIEKDILANVSHFVEIDGESPTQAPVRPGASESRKEDNYEVNVLIDQTGVDGAPIVVELNPTYYNLFGKVEKESRMGTFFTNFTLIRPGSFHRANGGYLVIPVIELLRNPISWDSLKRALRNREISIEEVAERYGMVSAKTLKPQAIPLNLQIILIGDDQLYRLLYTQDKDFRDLFKVKADFDLSIDRTPEHIESYIGYVSRICRQENLSSFDDSALAKVVEHGSRLADNKEKLSAKFGDISDIVRESCYYARQEQAKYVSASHVMRTIDERHYRSNLIQEKMSDYITEGVIKIDLEGLEVGQINGLSVINIGDISFGRPSRITCNVNMGKGNVITIDREVKLSGPIHDKGVLILSAFFAEKFAQERPMQFNASLVFEQSYGMIDGDSASSTELYAILSALSGMPLRQGIAVTGSVNQKGEVQAIGGANEKIEGFFELCKTQGLTGDQGVLIPESNVRNLMLKEEVLNAVRDGKFSIWPVSRIEEGIEILTSQVAGEKSPDGKYPQESVFGKVEEKLANYANKLEALRKKQESKTEA